MSNLSTNFKNVLCPDLVLPASSGCNQSSDSSSPTDFKRFGRHFILHPETEIADYIIVYIGAEGLFLSACMLTLNKCRFVVYEPETRSLKSDAWNVNRMLNKRYRKVEQARDANFVGILVGTLDVKDYMEVIQRLQVVIQNAGKRWRIYSAGAINVAKQANLEGFDVFVMVACPENSLIDDSEYLKPIVTPYEMELACSPDFVWTGNYEVDFRQLLPGFQIQFQQCI